MPITPFLAGRQFDVETTRAMGVAFETTRTALRLADTSDPFMRLVAERRLLSLRKRASVIPMAYASEH